jgi:hypothetical protein
MAQFDPTNHSAGLVAEGSLAILLSIMRRGKPKACDGHSVTIAPDKCVCIAMIAGGTVILGLAIWLAVFQHVLLTAVPLALLGLACMLTPLRSFTDLHDVIWSEAAIEGPSKVSGLTLGRTRALIGWHDVKRVGYAISGNWFVEAADGRRVYWTPIHRGFGRLVDTIKILRPDLKLPPRM